VKPGEQHDCRLCRYCRAAGLTLTDWQHAYAKNLINAVKGSSK